MINYVTRIVISGARHLKQSVGASRKVFVPFILSCVIALFASFDRANAYTQWEWQAVGYAKDSGIILVPAPSPNTVYQTKEAALSAIQSLGPGPSVMTEFAGLKPGANGTQPEHWYKAPKRTATIEQPFYTWSYSNGDSSASEAEAIAFVRSQLPESCRDNPWTVSPEYIFKSFGGEILLEFKRIEVVDCSSPAWIREIYRHTPYRCPSGYVNYGGTDRTQFTSCLNSQRAILRGRALECATGSPSGQVGNPCNVITGDKSHSETDYRAPGIDFARHYHSAADGWSHTYSRKLLLQNGDPCIPRILVRESGYQEIIAGSCGSGRSDSGSGIRLTRTGSGATAEWTARLSDGSSEIYSSTGVLLRIIDSVGLVTTLQYTTDPATSSQQLSSIVGPFGHRIDFSYADGRIQSMLNTAGEATHYEYDAAGNLVSVRATDGTARQYLYEDARFPNALTGIIDENTTRLSTYAYDATGRVISSERATGVGRVNITYNANDSLVVDALGLQTRYTLAAQLAAQPRRITSIARGTLTTQFQLESGSQRRVIQQTDPRGIVTTFSYDVDHLLSRTEAYGNTKARTTSYSYRSDVDDLPTLITESGRTTSLSYNPSNGTLLSKTITDIATGQARAWIYTYNASGQILTTDGPRTDVSDVSTYTYYNCAIGFECGQVQTITNALGHVTTYSTYDAHGQPLTITDPNGVVTTLTYDARQRLTSRKVGTEQSTYEYWPTGLLKKTTLPDGSYLEYTYDAAQRLTHINDQEGNRIHYVLDAMGNRTGEQVRDPSNVLKQTSTRVFNALNQLHQEIGAAGTTSVTTTYGYDNNGNPTSIAAPLNRNTTQTYDELDRLSTITDPNTGLAQYGYNALDQLISVTDPKGLVTSYAVNALGDLNQLVSPDTGTTTNAFDSGGNLRTRTDARGVTATYVYDALDRVTSAEFKLGSTVDQTLVYTYDTGARGKGQLTGASDSAHSLAWTYDDLGRVLTANQIVGTVSKTTSYAYANGQRQRVTTPSGQVVTYGYTNGKVTSISVNSTVLVSNILYAPFGEVRQWTWSNGSVSVRTFDQDGKVVQIDSAGLKTYSYDDAFRITGISDNSNSALSWTLGYDNLDRLTSASKTGTTLGYSYDANGNRLTQAGSNATTFTVATSSNRLSSTAGALARTYSYDNVGNTTGFTGIAFAYNYRGRMKSSTKSGVTTNYTYNALGQLIKKGSNTLYYYDDVGHLLGTYNGSGALIEEIVWLGDIPIVTLRPKVGGGINIYNIHTDHLNTPRLVTGSVNPGARWRWDSDPFGVGVPNNNPTGAGAFEFNLRFPGQIYLAETGLNYNYFRDYDPATGRYVQSDPIGLDGGLNTYAYVGGNPVSATDPAGLQVVIPLPVPPPPVPGYPSDGGLGDIMRAVGDAITDLAYFCGGQCPPCKTISGKIVAVGTIGYRPLDVISDTVKQHGVYGSHHNLFKANQMPFPKCDCFWQKLKDVAKPDQLQPSWIAIEPFVN